MKNDFIEEGKEKTDEEVVPHSFIIARITQALVGALYEEKVISKTCVSIT
jgi:hypothetical protein